MSLERKDFGTGVDSSVPRIFSSIFLRSWTHSIAIYMLGVFWWQSATAANRRVPLPSPDTKNRAQFALCFHPYRYLLLESSISSYQRHETIIESHHCCRSFHMAAEQVTLHYEY